MSGPISPQPTVVARLHEAVARLADSEAVRVSLLAAWVASLPAEVSLDWSGPGPVRVRRGTARAGTFRSGDSTVAVRLAGPWGDGLVAWDAVGAGRILAQILGLKVPRSVRAPSAFERGGLAALTASVIGALGLGARFSVGLAPAPTLSFALCVPIELEANGSLVMLHVFLPPPLGPALRADTELVARLEVPLVVLGALTTLPAPDLASARPGDAVVFDGVPSGQLQPRWLRVGMEIAPLRTLADGALVIAGPFDGLGGGARDRERTRVIGAAPAEVGLELARLTLPAGEVFALPHGGRLLSPTPVPAAGDEVALSVAATAWARGRVFDLDGTLAVRLLEAPGHMAKEPGEL